MSKGPRRRTQFIPTLALFTGSCAFSLAVALVVLGGFGSSVWRVSGSYVPDPELGFFHRPGARHDWTDSNGNREQVSINSIGLRGPEIAPRKSRPRVLLIGDSMVFGYGVVDGDTLSSQLQALLEGSPTPMEVINGGVKGYGIDQEFKLLGRLMSLRPDYVVWFLYENDFSEFSNIERTLYDLDAAGDRLVERDVRKSIFYLSTQLYVTLKDHLPDTVDRWLLSRLWQSTNELATWIDDHGARRSPILSRKLRLFTRSLAEASSRPGQGFRVLIALLPSRNPRADLSFLEAHSALPILNLHRDARLEKDREELFLAGDSHLSAAGNRRVAEIVRKWIAAL